MTLDSVTFERRRIGVLVSGRGSNLQALIGAVADGRLDATIAVVISNVAHAQGLERARRAGIPALHVDHRGWPSRTDFDAALARELRSQDVDLVCLAGFMRICGAPLLEAYPGRILNIHPSLLPEYKGLDTHARVLAARETQHGASVHFVTAELDGGPVVMQGRLRVGAGDTPESISARVHALEHIIYPHVCSLIAARRIEWRRGTVYFDGEPLVAPLIEENDAAA